MAVLISGEIRTFVLKEQVLHWRRLIEELRKHFQTIHVYMVLKIPQRDCSGSNRFVQSEQGLQHFKELLVLLEPIYIYCFYDFLYENGMYGGFNGQLKMIDMCIEKAMEHPIHYDLFFRIRPDCAFLIQEIASFFTTTQIVNAVYTSIKYDAPGSDHAFVFNQDILNEWWIKKVRPKLLAKHSRSPEYVIFSGIKIHQSFKDWLIREYNVTHCWINTWNTSKEIKGKYNSEMMPTADIVSYLAVCKTLPHDVFLTKFPVPVHTFRTLL